jgi:hypothetical protein
MSPPSRLASYFQQKLSLSFNMDDERNQFPTMEQAGANAALKSFSCLTCRQRKVKCDRHNPCSNCVRSSRQCNFIAPVRGKRKRSKNLKEGLHAKLRRYEELLKSYGANIEQSDNGDSSDGELSEPDVEIAEDETRKSHNSPFALDETKPRLITKNGSSRYYDKYV